MPFQMALDEILFRRAEEDSLPPVFRFYMSSEPWVSVGYSKRYPSQRYQVPLGRVPICRRITGGGTVHHGKDVIFSIVAKKTHDESFGSVRMSYLKIHEAVKSAVESLGQRPRFYRCDENLPKGEDCFLHPIATDLAVSEQKIAGGAQKRSRGALLHQESLQVRGLDRETLIPALKKSFESRFGINLKTIDLEPVLFRDAEQLAEEKYGIGTSIP